MRPLMALLISSVTILLFLFTVSIIHGDFYCTESAIEAIKKMEAMNCFEYWFNRYQTFLGGILTIVGAGLAFWAVRSQIAQTERLTTLSRTKKERAMTAFSSFALDGISDYAAECVNTFKIIRQEKQRDKNPIEFVAPPLPDHNIAALRDCIEFGNSDYALAIAHLIRTIQIQHSRLGLVQQQIAVYPLLSEQLGGEDFDAVLENAMFDALNIHAQASSLFESIRQGYIERTTEISYMYNDAALLEVNLDEWPQARARMGNPFSKNLPNKS